MLDALNTFAAKFNIQIIFTTHSLTLLEQASKYQDDRHRRKQIKLIYLKKEGNQVIVKDDINYDFIKNHLNRNLMPQSSFNKVSVFTEDKEAAIFAKSLLGSKRTKHLKFQDKISLGSGNLIQLASVKIPPFIYPNSIIILDGDVRTDKKKPNEVEKLENILLLPTYQSPEQIIAGYLYELDATDSLWSSIDAAYEHENCFMDYSNDDIQNDRVKAKNWFNSQLTFWGRNACKVLNPWKKANTDLVKEFCENFDILRKKY